MKKLLFLLLFTIATYGQVSTGQEQEFDYGIKNNAAQTVVSPNTVVVQGADGTYGKSSVNVLPLSTATIDALKLKSYLSTGLLKNGLISINADPTKFNVSAGIGIISNFDDPANPTSVIVNFPAFTGVTPTYLSTGNITYVAINSTPAIVMQATPFTPIQRRDLIELGAVIHSNLTTINVVNNISSPSNSGTNQLHDVMDFIGALNLEGNKYSANGANLSLNKSAGIIGKRGVNFANDWKDPHRLAQPAGTALTFRYRTQNGTEGADVTELNPALYDLNNVLTAVPNNKFTIQTVVMFQTGLTRVLYGQNFYDDLASAKSAIFTRNFVIESNAKENGIIRAYIIMRNTTTSLQNVVDADIQEAQKFGGVASGGVALTFANIVAALGYTPENVANKSGTLTASSTLYPNNDAVITGLALKQNKFIINVKDYGATGNGTTDDTAAINSAFAALPASGGVLFFPNGIYHSVTGYTFTGDNISIIGESMPRCANDLNSLTGGTILKGQVLIDGNNITVENIGIDFGITYSNTYRSGNGGNALVIHDVALASIKRNIKVNNVIGLIRMGDFTDIQAAFHAILIEGVQFGTANNIIGVGGWFGVVVKATDFVITNITGRENDAASVYIKSNTYAPTSRVSASNITVSNYVARGNIGVLVQSSDAEMETVSLSNVTVSGGNMPIRVESETTHPLVGFSIDGLVSRNTGGGMSVRGGVYSPVFNNCVVYSPAANGFVIEQNSIGQNAIDVTASNIRIVPTATTTDAIKVTNSNTKVMFSNVNVADTDGKTLIAGSIINLQDNSDISNYVGVLKRNNVVSDIYRYKGGGTTTSLSNISTTANTRVDFANPTISLANGYLASDAPYLQSYNNVNNTSNTLNLNPFGGNVNIGNLAGTGTRTVVADASGNLSATNIAPISGTYTPTITGISNYTSSVVVNASYTVVGEVVTVQIDMTVKPTTTTTLTEYSVTLPITVATFVGTQTSIGSGTFYNGDFLSMMVSKTNSTTAKVAFKTEASANSGTVSIIFSYFK